MAAPLTVTVVVVVLALVSWQAATAPPPQGSAGQADVLTGGRPIWDLVRTSDALRAFLEHRAAGAPGAVAVVVDTGSAAAVQRARDAVGDLQQGVDAAGPFIFATFHRTGVSEPRVLPTWTQLQQAVSAVVATPQGAAEARAPGPGPLDAVLGVAGVAPRGTRIILVTEDGAKGEDREAAAVAEVARALRGGGFELDAWTLGSCSDYAAVANISQATGGTLGCGDLPAADAVDVADPENVGELKPVTLAVRRGQPGPLEVNVDSSVHRLDVEVRGSGAALRSPTGRRWELTPRDGAARLSLDRRHVTAGTWALTPADGHPLLDAEVRGLSGLDVRAALADPATPTTPARRQTSGAAPQGPQQGAAGKFEKVRVHEPRGVTVASVKLLDVSGRPLGSAERAAVYNATRQVFRRATKPGQAESAGEESEWEIKNLQGKPSLVEMMGHNSNGEVFTRVSNLTKVDNIVIVPPPFNIELNPSSQLITRPGQALQLTYDVTNNLDIPQLLVFYMRDQLAFLQRVVPVQFLVPPRKTIPVVGYLGISQSATEGQTDRVNFHAQSQTIQREIIKSSVVYVQQEQTSDVWSPSIWGTWKSTCTGAWDTATCATNTWTIDFEIQDRDSGLLSVITYPKGIQFRTDFVSGTREKVIAYYTASCCSKKVEVIATDLRGNTNRQTFDVGSQFLNAGEIAGISVGVIALILIVIIIVLAILLCRRRESLRLERRLSSRLAAREVR